MPPVFGPVSPSPIRLKSCAGAIGIARSPSHSASSDSSSPSRNSSTSTRAPASPKRRSTKKSRSAALRLGGRLGDDHALARGEAVGLQHRGVGGAVHLRLGLLVGGELHPRRGRHAGLLHQLLRERLAALDPRGRGARAERAQALGLERVHDAGDERRLGPDHGQVDLLARRPAARCRRRPRPPRRSSARPRRCPRCRACTAPRARAGCAAARARSRARGRRRRRRAPSLRRGSTRRSRRRRRPGTPTTRLLLRATSPRSTP